jgi:hypothetical protein
MAADGQQQQRDGLQERVDAPQVCSSSGRAQADAGSSVLCLSCPPNGAFHPGLDRVACNQAGVWPVRQKTAPRKG